MACREGLATDSTCAARFAGLTKTFDQIRFSFRRPHRTDLRKGSLYGKENIMCSLSFLALRGSTFLPYLEPVGALRLSVFHEYPYLYQGTMEEEHNYLRTYANAESSLVVLALDSGKVVGATTCLAMTEGDLSFRTCFENKGWDLGQICYFGESVLLPQYRGQGAGKVFCQERLAHATQLGAKWAAFCAVDRPIDHPSRPPEYRPLDSFWKAQGFQKHPELQATFVWKEIGEAIESPKTLTFWLRELSSNPT